MTRLLLGMTAAAILLGDPKQGLMYLMIALAFFAINVITSTHPYKQ